MSADDTSYVEEIIEDDVVVPLSARRGKDGHEKETAQDDREEAQDTLPWTARARRVSQTAKILSVAIPLCWLIGWPLGTMTAGKVATGVWAFAPGYSLDVVIWAATAAVLIRLVGYVLSLALRLEASAQLIVQNSAAREERPFQVSTLNAEIDRALERLAEAEKLIRQQVKAIDTAGEALGTGTAKSAERLERERKALMDLAEEMNREADRFADKIAERTASAAKGTVGLEKLMDAEKDFDTQLTRLESVSARSLDRFEQLAQAMDQRSEELRQTSAHATEHHQSLTNQLEQNAARIEAAQAELAEQSTKLEALMMDQRRRAERLAKAVTEQANRAGAAKVEPLPPAFEERPAPAPVEAPKPKPKPKAEKPAPQPKSADKRDHAWKDILAKVEEANPEPLRKETPPVPAAPKPAPAPSTSGRITDPDDMDLLDRLIVRIQNYSLVLQTQLFGGPGHEDLDRFENGERQIFAKSLISRDADMLRGRIKTELTNNPVFRERTTEFLRDFDTILEPLSNEAGGEDAIQTYLTSPLGRLYMLTGSAAGHFE